MLGSQIKWSIHLYGEKSGWQLTFLQVHLMTKATGVKHLKEFESRIFKYKGHSFDHGRTQGLLFK